MQIYKKLILKKKSLVFNKLWFDKIYKNKKILVLRKKNFNNINKSQN